MVAPHNLVNPDEQQSKMIGLAERLGSGSLPAQSSCRLKKLERSAPYQIISCVILLPAAAVRSENDVPPNAGVSWPPSTAPTSPMRSGPAILVARAHASAHRTFKQRALETHEFRRTARPLSLRRSAPADRADRKPFAPCADHACREKIAAPLARPHGSPIGPARSR
jgi:hypothetical protein